MTAPESLNPPRRFLRFSLREMLLLVTVLAVLLGLLGQASHRFVSSQRHASANARLLAAAEQGDLHGAADAIADGANPNACDELDCTALFRAVQRNDAAMVGRLLDLGADVNYPLSEDRHVLFLCIESGQEDMFDMLLARGAMLDKRPLADPGDWLLSATIQARLPPPARLRMTEIALRHGALTASGDRGAQAMFLSRAYGDSSMADLLRKYGASYTLREAIAFNRLDEVKELVRENPALVREPLYLTDGATRRQTPVTPLGRALVLGWRDIAAFLLEAGAPLDAQESAGATMLHRAAEGGNADLIKAVLSRGLDVNVRDSFQSTPLHVAVMHERLDAVAALVAAGADVNAQDERLQTPLHAAIYRPNRQIVQKLLAAGADPLLSDRDGKTPRDVAREGNNLELLP